MQIYNIKIYLYVSVRTPWHLREGLEDRMVVDGCEVEAEVNVKLRLRELVNHELLDLVLTVNLLLVCEEEVAVDLVDEEVVG